MKRSVFQILLFILLCGLFQSCIERYEAPETNQILRLLVVDGSLYGDEPYIDIYRTRNLKDTVKRIAVDNAVVSIESSDGERHELFQREAGKYYPQEAINNVNKKYRLIIVIKEKEYHSEYVNVEKSPPIEDLFWELKEDGVQIYLNTRDVGNKKKYYKWDYEETWHFNSAFQSLLVWNPLRGELEARKDDIYNCWRTERSTDISIFSTVALSQDVVHRYPLLFISSDSWKFDKNYSILVKQKTTSREAFEFWELLKKNSENLGSLFDPQPSQVTGNIKNVDNPEEKVIGFFSINVPTEKRIFIKSSELPSWNSDSPYDACEADTVLNKDVNYMIGRGIVIPIMPIQPAGSAAPIGYTAGAYGCVDCRARGTSVKPDFWVD